MKKNDSYDEVQVDYVKKVGVFKEIKKFWFYIKMYYNSKHFKVKNEN